jgi:hypothetical protein
MHYVLATKQQQQSLWIWAGLTKRLVASNMPVESCDVIYLQQ